jgi:integrase
MADGTNQARRERLNDDTAEGAAYEPRGTSAQQFLWDGGRSPIAGFGLKLTSTAAAGTKDGKAWVFQYRNHAGASRRLTLGTLATMNAAAARKKATDAFNAVRRGEDPQAEKVQDRKAQTLGALMADWLAWCERRVDRAEAERAAREAGNALPVTRSGGKSALGMSRSTYEGYRTKAEVHLIPAFGALRPEELTREAIARWRSDPAASRRRPPTPQAKKDGRKAKPAPAPRPLGEGGVNTVLRILAAFCGWAQEHGHMPSNPAAGLGQYAVREAGNPLALDEVGGLQDTLTKHEASEPVHVAAVRFIMFTGCRLGEALQLRWADIDEAAGRVRIMRHKTERQTGVKELLLTDPLRAVLAQARAVRVVGCPYVFPSTIDRSRFATNGHMDAARVRELKRSHLGKTAIEKFWRKVRAEAGLTANGRRRLHDLRHTAGTLAGAAGVPETAIAVMLGHASTLTTKRYVRRDASHGAAAVNAVADVLAFPPRKAAG